MNSLADYLLCMEKNIQTINEDHIALGSLDHDEVNQASNANLLVVEVIIVTNHMIHLWCKVFDILISLYRFLLSLLRSMTWCNQR